jgi:hypothetical protein
MDCYQSNNYTAKSLLVAMTVPMGYDKVESAGLRFLPLEKDRELFVGCRLWARSKAVKCDKLSKVIPSL